jgi:5'-nucleotidase
MVRHTRKSGGIVVSPRPETRRFARAAAILACGAIAIGSAVLPGCGSGNQQIDSACPPGTTCQVRLTLLHTADVHSRLLPYDLEIAQVDSELGLGSEASIQNVGGIARVSYILGRERARSDRVLHLDSGDCFEGAPIFNFFSGEPEVRSMSAIGTDAAAIGNHEFDRGALNVATQMKKWKAFPLLAANYKLAPVEGASSNTELSEVLEPFTVFDQEGLKIAVIGMGNLSSLSSIFDQPNSLGITPLDTVETSQFYVDLLRPYVDFIVILSHLGLEEDQRMITNTTGIDVVLGGHNHIVIDPPQVVQDCSSDPSNPGYIWVLDPNLSYDPSVPPPNDATHPDPVNHPYQMHRACSPRNVVLQHSGAFAKYVGRLDLVVSNNPKDIVQTTSATYDPNDGFEVVSHEYTAFPITDTVPDDPVLDDLLQPYIRRLTDVSDLNVLVGFAPDGASRTAPQGGDSPLGNLIATAMWLRLGVQTDLSMTNTTGIRADLNPGPTAINDMFNVFPFDNTITKMQLSGFEVQEMFDFIARRSEGRSCESQAQIAGARVRLDCTGCSRPGSEIACNTDNDCIASGSGPCDTVHHICSVVACAEQIYIGYSNTACMSDADCPLDSSGNQMPGSCDTSLPIAQRHCMLPVALENVYDFATSNYLAAGGSGFRVLQANTTQFNTQINQRDALIDYIQNGHPCGYNANANTNEGLTACSTDADCMDSTLVCACPGIAQVDPTTDACTARPGASCDPAVGRCVLSACRDGVSQFHASYCSGYPSQQQTDSCLSDLSPCDTGGEDCKVLACIDQNLGAVSDNRVEMLGR